MKDMMRNFITARHENGANVAREVNFAPAIKPSLTVTPIVTKFVWLGGGPRAPPRSLISPRVESGSGR